MSRRSPASSATRSECSPAQLIRKSASNSPAGVVTLQPAPSRRTDSARAPVTTRAPRSVSLRDQGVADPGIIHDAFLRHAQRGHAAHVGFDLAHLFARHPAQALEPVGGAALVEGAQARHFGVVHRHHELAADFVRDRVLPAELHHLANAGDGQARLHRSRFVVQAAVQHAAVVAGLVAAHACLFFQYADARAGKTLAQAVRRGQSHDTPADDHYPLGIHERTSSVVYGPTCISPPEGRGCRTRSWYSVK